MCARLRRSAAWAVLAAVTAAPPVAAEPSAEPPIAPPIAPAVDPGTLAAFERLLAREDSATAALTQWCQARGLAEDPLVTARKVARRARDADAATRRLLAVGAREPVGYRHVALACGATVLSLARNWYVPARLPPAMRRQLAANRPFGAVIAPLGFRRERLASTRGPAAGCPAATVLTNRALILLPDGEPLALVIECYQPTVLGPR